MSKVSKGYNPSKVNLWWATNEEEFVTNRCKEEEGGDMKVKTVETSQLSGAALDWAVAKSVAKENVKIEQCKGADAPAFCVVLTNGTHWTPSTDWSQGGPLMQEEQVEICWQGIDGKALFWIAHHQDALKHIGDTPLIAACRAIVAAELGDDVEVPAELVEASDNDR